MRDVRKLQICLVFVNFALKQQEHSLRQIGIECASAMVINSACDEKIAVHLLNMVQPNFVDGGMETEC